jgi:hypothetical protein
MTECPQWRLKSPHYLNVPGTHWEQNETSRETGKANRVIHTVGLLLNPADPADCDRNGEIIVYTAIDGIRGPRYGHAFIGEPTPEMEPLNNEAEVISASLMKKWEHPFDTFQTSSEGEFSTRLLAGIEKALNQASANNLAETPGATVVPKVEYDALKNQMAALQKQMADILAATTKPAAEPGRRV